MRLLIIAVYMLMIAFLGSPESIAKSPEQTRAAFRSVAPKMQFFLCDDFLSRMRPAGPSPSRIEEYMKLLDVICDKGNDRQTVIELLRDRTSITGESSSQFLRLIRRMGRPTDSGHRYALCRADSWSREARWCSVPVRGLAAFFSLAVRSNQ